MYLLKNKSGFLDSLPSALIRVLLELELLVMLVKMSYC